MLLNHLEGHRAKCHKATSINKMSFENHSQKGLKGLKGLQPVDSSLFFSKKDPKDPRFGDFVRAANASEANNANEAKGGENPFPFYPHFEILGYPDDEGIEINGGRKGASEGPNAIRSILYRMTPSTQSHLSNLHITDLGNVPTSVDLRHRHQKGQEVAYQSLQSKKCFMGLGGGHDYAYADGAAFLDYCFSTSKKESKSQSKGKNQIQSQSKKPLIINFDAHLDVRDCSRGFSSGTPFFRLLKDYPKGSFHLLEVGIQPQCTSLFHEKWLKEQGGWILGINEIYASPSLERESIQGDVQIPQGCLCIKLLSFLREKALLQSPTFISLDMDAFDSHSSPGCSQSWPRGLEVKDFLLTLKHLIHYLQVPLFSVYELSPSLDPLGQSTKLAALCCYQFIEDTLNKALAKSLKTK